MYLTGCQEPESALVMVVCPDGSFESSIFVREKNAHSELWEGPRTGEFRLTFFIKYMTRGEVWLDSQIEGEYRRRGNTS